MSSVQNVLATMITTTTYGTWLPGDLRGYVDAGVILPGDPMLLDRSRQLMRSDPVFLMEGEQEAAFDALRRATDEFHYTMLEVCIESWHAHWLIDHAFDDVAIMAGRMKTRMRQALSRGRIWTEGYDARFCFDADAVGARRSYIRRHRGWRALPHGICGAPDVPESPGGAGG